MADNDIAGDDDGGRRRSRRQRPAAASSPASGAPESTGSGSVKPATGGEASANQLFERLINAQADPSALKQSGFMWVPDDENGFTVAEVKDRNNDSVTVQLEDGRTKTVKVNEIHPMNPQKLDGVDDMARLSHLNEPSVLHNLTLRYKDNNIYTYSGLFLVAINPYKRLPIYTPEVVERHKGKRREDSDPHVFTIADTAYRQMLTNKSNQSMLITGESGAGKTENTKKVIQFLTSVAGAKGGGGVLEQQLLRTNPLLEAFGNAKTIRNNNSSRFGKFIEIDFNAAGYIIGTKIQHYLLETTRVVGQNQNERNFHFFFQLCQVPEQKAKYQLASVDSYKYLNQSGCTTIPGVDDRKDFADTIQCMEVIGMVEDERESVCATTASLLHLGNIEFEPEKNTGSFIKDKNALNITAKLLGIDAAALEDAFCHPTFVARNEKVKTNATPEQAEFNRNALTRSVYSRMFDWIVKKINDTLIPKEKIANFIGVLDIAGFEIFETNSFEQLCINYTNEKLQQFFNTHMFKKEQEEYLKEKIEWTFIDFGLDLQPTIDLIEKQTGVMKILDELTIMGGANAKEENFVAEIGKRNADCAKYKKSPFFNHCFHLSHYAGEVIYNTKAWFLKNIDPLNDDCKKTMRNSSRQFVKNLYADALADSSAKGVRFRTVSTTYKDQVASLMQLLNSTEPHFIRCIVPNSQQKPGIIEPHLVLHQLRCNGVLEGIRISRKGYPGRIPFKDFEKRYSILAKKSDLSNEATAKGRCMLIIKAAELIETKQYKTGATKVFLKAGVEAALEEMREAKIAQIIITAQAACAGCIARKQFALLKKKLVSIRMIQRNWKAFLQLKDWSWWQVFQKARPLISAWKQDDEMKKLKEEVEKQKKKLADEEKAKQGLYAEKDQLNKQLQEMQVAMQVADGKQEELDKAISNLKNKIADLEGTIASLSKDKQIMEGERANLQMLISDKEKKLKDKDSDLSDQSDKARELQTQIDNFKRQVADKDNSIIKLDMRIKTLEGEGKDWRTKFEEEQQKSYDLERMKNGLDDKIKELNYQLDLVAKARVESDNKNKGLNDEIKENKRNLTSLQAKIDGLSGDLQKAKVDFEKKDNEFKSKSKEMEDLDREKKKLDGQLKDVNDRFADEQRKRTALENQLRYAKGDLTERDSTIDALNDKIKNLEDQLSQLRQELADAKKRISELEDANATLESKKTQLEKDLKDTQTKLQDEQDRNKQAIERLNSKLEDQARDLGDQISELTNQKNNLQRQLQQAQKQAKDTQKNLGETAKTKDDIEAKLRKYELDLQELANNLDSEKRKTNDLEKEKRDLNNDLLNTQQQLTAAKEEGVRQENRFRQLKKTLDEKEDALSSLETEKSDLEKAKQSLEKTVSGLKTDLDTAKTQLGQANLEKDNLSTEGKNLKSQIQNLQDQISKLDAQLKQKTEEAANLSAELEGERGNKNNLDKKKKQVESDVKKLQTRLEEEEKKNKDEQYKREKAEQSVRETELQLQALKTQLDDLQRKLKANDEQGGNFQNQLKDANDQLNKLRNEKRDLKSQLDESESHRSDLEHQAETATNAVKSLQTQVNDLSKKYDDEKSGRATAEAESNRVKADLDRIREELGAELRKAKQAADKLKQQYESHDSDLQRQIAALTEERNQLKKDLKNASKNDKAPVTGGVDQEIVDKIKKDFDQQFAKVQAQLSEEQSSRADAESKKRVLESQIQELKDRLDNEERGRKKSESQRKALAAEVEELRDLAEEAEELREELTRVRQDQEKTLGQLRQEADKERTQRTTLEESNKKLKDDLENVKRELDVERNKDSGAVSKLKSQYEAELQDMEQLVTKMKREKQNALKTQKKFERDQRELSNKLTVEQQQRTAAENKVAYLERELNKSKSELEFHSKNIIKFETENQRLTSELSDYKDRSLKLEDEVANLRESQSKANKKSKGGKYSRKAVDSDDDD